MSGGRKNCDEEYLFHKLDLKSLNSTYLVGRRRS